MVSADVTRRIAEYWVPVEDLRKLSECKRVNLSRPHLHFNANVPAQLSQRICVNAAARTFEAMRKDPLVRFIVAANHKIVITADEWKHTVVLAHAGSDEVGKILRGNCARLRVFELFHRAAKLSDRDVDD
jgi:hypothetical protein